MIMRPADLIAGANSRQGSDLARIGPRKKMHSNCISCACRGQFVRVRECEVGVVDWKCLFGRPLTMLAGIVCFELRSSSEHVKWLRGFFFQTYKAFVTNVGVASADTNFVPPREST